MEPLSMASAFASIIGLISQFKSERNSKPDGIEEFLEWAESKNIELRSLVQTNVRISIGIKALLSQERAELFSRLSDIDRILSTIASNVQGFSDLARALNPEAVLSAQAVSILDQMERGRVSKVLKSESHAGLELLVLEGDPQVISYSDTQFISDDLHTLVESGLLRLDYNSAGGVLYIFTRQAKALAIELRESREKEIT